MKEGVLSVSVGKGSIYIDSRIFAKLFGNSHVYHKRGYRDAVDKKKITLKCLQELAREANIPYSLFFAPEEVVDKQIERNNRELFKGVNETQFYMTERGKVEIRDINLIIKDIIKRQKLMKKFFPEEKDNEIVYLLKRSNMSIEKQANAIVCKVGLDLETLRSSNKKEDAYNYLVNLCESHNIYISRSRIGVMPQNISTKVAFSGLAVRDKKFPSIFLYSKDETMVRDPAGRRIFTILLLLVCIARGRFCLVSYDSKSTDLTNDDEYRIVEEILMPKKEFEQLNISDISELNTIADRFKVTPRAALVRLRKLNKLNKRDYDEIYCILDIRYAQDKKQSNHPYKVSDATKVKTYCGLEFTKRVFNLYDRGRLSEGDLRRVLLFNKKPKKFLQDLQASL